MKKISNREAERIKNHLQFVFASLSLPEQKTFVDLWEKEA